jgi:hypothetical protein
MEVVNAKIHTIGIQNNAQRAVRKYFFVKNVHITGRHAQNVKKD